MSAPIRVTVWNEFYHENPDHWEYVKRAWMGSGYSEESAIEETEGVREIYPEGHTRRHRRSIDPAGLFRANRDAR